MTQKLEKWLMTWNYQHIIINIEWIFVKKQFACSYKKNKNNNKNKKFDENVKFIQIQCQIKKIMKIQ